MRAEKREDRDPEEVPEQPEPTNMPDEPYPEGEEIPGAKPDETEPDSSA